MTHACIGMYCQICHKNIPIGHYVFNDDNIKTLSTHMDDFDKRIINLTEHKNRQVDENRKTYNRLTGHENSLRALWEKIKELEKLIIDSNKKPHKCPVCFGKGEYLIVGSHYHSEDPVNCKPCEGKGIIWG